MKRKTKTSKAQTSKTPPHDLVTRAELARRKGVTRGAVTHACKTRLAAARVGRRIDANHENVRQWLSEPDDAPTKSYAALLLEKRAAEVQRLTLQNRETEGRLISRELVKTHVFGAIDAANRRLLGNASKTIAHRVSALARAGAPVEEIERTVRDIIAQNLQFVKVTATRVLRQGERESRNTKNESRAPTEAA
jgi:hypothetical protein